MSAGYLVICQDPVADGRQRQIPVGASGSATPLRRTCVRLGGYVYLGNTTGGSHAQALARPGLNEPGSSAQPTAASCAVWAGHGICLR